MGPNGRVTGAQVAAEAGVSRSTVSLVLNGRHDVRIAAETRLLVQAAAQRLGYRPSPVGRALRSGQSDLVLALMPHQPSAPLLTEILDRLGDFLASCGLLTIEHRSPRWRGRLAEVWQGIAPDVVVTFEQMQPDDLQATQNAGVAVVTAVFLDGPDRTATTVIRQPDIVQTQIEHLVARGHHRIAVAASADPQAAPFSDARVAAARDTCARLRLPAPDVVALSVTHQSALRALEAWASHTDGPTAIACYNDEIALAVLSAARTRGESVPGRWAVIGIDDAAIADVTSPGLTTVHLDVSIDAHALASQVATLMGRELTAPAPDPSDAVRLVHRQST